MALLLKIKPSSLVDNSAVVPRMKSDRLSEADLGEQVFVWLADGDAKKGGLAFRTEIAGIEDTEMLQVRNPSKTKPGYKLRFHTLRDKPNAELRTDDLSDVRYSEGPSGFERLGRLHRDRNDKIIRLTTAEAIFLKEQFPVS